MDAEPARRPEASLGLVARLTGHFAKLSPRALAWLAGLAAAALLVQAAATGVVLVKRDHTATQRSASVNEAADRFSGSGPRPLVRFAPDARVAEITAVLGHYRASIIDTTNDGMFRLQFGNKPMTKDEVADLLGRLQHEKTISLVAMPWAVRPCRWHTVGVAWRLRLPGRSTKLRRGNSKPENSKKSCGFERAARLSRPMHVGAAIPPHRGRIRREPIHPQRPYGLTRPAVPPDGSFVVGTACSLCVGDARARAFRFGTGLSFNSRAWRRAFRPQPPLVVDR
jgi:hypothetical protein